MNHTITIPYGNTHLTVDFSYDGMLTFRVDQLKNDRSGRELVEVAMADPVGFPRLSELVAGKKTFTIIFSNHTRPILNRDILPPMLVELRKGSPDIAVTLLVATGFHCSTTTVDHGECIIFAKTDLNAGVGHCFA